MDQKLTERMIFKRKDGQLRGHASRSIRRLGEVLATVTQKEAEVTVELECWPFTALNLPPRQVKDLDEADDLISEYIAECLALRDAISQEVFDRANRAYNNIINSALQEALVWIRTKD